MTEIITLENEHRWDEIIRSMNNYDFYHLSKYHSLDKTGKAILFHYQNKSDEFAFPFLLREIPETSYKDISSVYGYTGPLSKNEIPSLSNIKLFQEELKKYFEENNIVSVFSMLHPILKTQDVLLNGLGETIKANTTIAINLKLSETEQKKQYARSTKYKINLLKKNEFYVKEAKSQKDVEAFINIYKENMNRVNAAPKYYFPDDYFYTFFEKINSTIFLALHKDEVVSGSLCTYCHTIMQAHLNATSDRYLHRSPLNLVLDAAREKGIERNMSWLHLGGGRGGVDDSLFQFKSRFSQERFTFQIWKYIYNEKIYNELNEKKFGDKQPDSSFFPLYRK